ncbi:unnamed protein product, partial [Mesorhabditis spiculigera]
MSSMIAVKRPPPERFMHQSDPCASINSAATGASSRLVKSVSMKMSPIEMFTKDDLEKRLEDALQKRDDEWMKHEKDQISFLQSEGSEMLKALHGELHRLTTMLRDARRKLDVGVEDAEEAELLHVQIKEKEERIAILEAQLEAKEASLKDIERKVNATIEKMGETIKIQSDRIRQLSGELQDRTLTVTQLSGQLRQYRLREAMATAQQRRRASAQNSGGSSPLISPSSPHRIFPPQRSMQMCFVDDDLASASVSVTYPGNAAKQRQNAMDTPLADNSSSNLEKPKTPIRRKSTSSSASNIYKN